MQIGTQGWDVPVKRELSINTLPEKVFVQGPFGHQTAIHDYEYSGDAPARLHSAIDDLLTGTHGKQNFINLFYSLPEIFAPIHEIASRVAYANWQLRRNMDDGVDYNNKYFNKLFSQPNPLMSMQQFVYQAVCYEYLTGANLEYINCPSTLTQDYTNILSWNNIPTQKVKFNKKPVDPYSATSLTDFIDSYEIIGSRKFESEKVMMMAFQDLNSGNALDGFCSPLLGAKKPITNLLAVYEARGTIYIKRGALGFVVSKKSDESGLISLTPKEHREVQQEFQNTYGLTGGKNTVGVTSSPVEFIKTAMSIAELQPFDETLADAVAIYATLRVPKHLVPSKDNSTFANADTDITSFYNNVIIQTANRYAQMWTNRFNIPNRYIFADFSHVAELQQNRKDKAAIDQIYGNVYLQRFTSGVGTLNEWITANDGVKSVLPLYDKKIFELDAEQLALVNSVLNLKAVSTGTPGSRQGTEKPAIE